MEQNVRKRLTTNKMFATISKTNKMFVMGGKHRTDNHTRDLRAGKSNGTARDQGNQQGESRRKTKGAKRGGGEHKKSVRAYPPGKTLFDLIDSKLDQALRIAVRTLGFYSLTDVYRNNKADEANKLASQILDTMIKK